MIIASFEYSINFIDPLDVFVGYDDTSSCCEDFGWLFLPCIYTNMEDHFRERGIEILDEGGLSEDMCMFSGDEKAVMGALENYVFDPSFMEDHGDVAVFKLLGPNGNEVYLHLYCYHNGYYSPGFSFNVGPDNLHINPSNEEIKQAKEIRSGSL